MSREHRQLLLCWATLLVLAAVELAGSFVPVARGLRPLLLLPACCMAALVCVMFMDLRRAPSLARGFAIAGLFWLAVLLGLAMVDPLTRAVYARGFAPGPHPRALPSGLPPRAQPLEPFTGFDQGGAQPTWTVQSARPAPP